MKRYRWIRSKRKIRAKHKSPRYFDVDGIHVRLEFITRSARLNFTNSFALDYLKFTKKLLVRFTKKPSNRFIYTEGKTYYLPSVRNLSVELKNDTFVGTFYERAKH